MGAKVRAELDEIREMLAEAAEILGSYRTKSLNNLCVRSRACCPNLCHRN